MRKLVTLVCLTLGSLLLVQTVHAADVDSDSDGLSDTQETSLYHTDPNLADTDADGFPDGTETKQGYSPLFGNKKKMVDVDSDKDGLNDAWEIALGTDITNLDTDGDGYKDGQEVLAGYDPSDSEPIKLEKIIQVNLKTQHLSYLLGNTVLEEFPISSGLKSTPTPVGKFTVLQKRPTVHYKGVGFDFPNTKWNLRFKQGPTLSYYIHGAYWHDKFGKPMSHGCVNVSYANMERLYNWAEVGTQIQIAKS